MKDKSINEAREAKKTNLPLYVCFGTAGVILAGYVGCNAIVSKKNEPYSYNIKYGTVSVRGEYFETFEKKNIKMIETTSDGNKVAIQDSNMNYWVVDDGSWYIIYSKDKDKYSLINNEGYIICGYIHNINEYLNDEEKEKTSFHIDELKDIENRANHKETMLLLGQTR